MVLKYARWNTVAPAEDQKVTEPGSSFLSSFPVVLGHRAKGKEKQTFLPLPLAVTIPFILLPRLF